MTKTYYTFLNVLHHGFPVSHITYILYISLLFKLGIIKLKIIQMHLPDIHYQVLSVDLRVRIRHRDRGLCGNIWLLFHGRLTRNEPGILVFIKIRKIKLCF